MKIQKQIKPEEIQSRIYTIRGVQVMLDKDLAILYDTNNFFKNRLSELKNRLVQLGSKKVTLDDDTWYWNLKPDIEAGEIIEL